ncbi:MAG: serine/threonine-protein kinase [Candidatus Eremiobacteraeota bacterium]|nr:serine/threonine-protein kinase [Candidatus Eremiobacteraeota bacterium]
MGFRVPAPDGKKEKDGLPVMVLMENTVLKGTYRTRYLTTGGMGIIYLAYRDAERYIIKEVEAIDAKKVMSLTQERSMLERLDHPGIVKVFDLFDEDGFCYLVMEYIEGMSLDRKVPIGSDIYLSESVVRDWALQLMDIFEFLHCQKPPVIYRDLKPKNIMLEKTGKIKLIDFGIARTFKEGKTQDTDHMGSMITASPEHYGGAQTDQRSDIYTLGATLHFILTNGKCIDREPFDFPGVKSLNARISDAFDAVVHRALAMNPDERFQSIAEMRFALRRSDPIEDESHDSRAVVVQDTMSLEEAKKVRATHADSQKIEVKFIDTAELLREGDLKRKTVTLLVGVLIGAIVSLLILGIMHWPRAQKIVSWTEARAYYGKEKIVEGIVVKVFLTSNNNIYLHFNMSFEKDFAVIIYQEKYDKFGCRNDPEGYFTNEYKGRHIRVKGTIQPVWLGGKEVPSIFIDEPLQIEKLAP